MIDSNTITEINRMRNTRTKGLSITNRNAYQQKPRENPKTFQIPKDNESGIIYVMK